MKKAKMKLKIQKLEEKLVKAEKQIRKKGIDTINDELLLTNQELRAEVQRLTRENEQLNQQDLERETLMRRMIRYVTKDAPGNASGKDLQMFGNTVGEKPFKESPVHSVFEDEKFGSEG